MPSGAIDPNAQRQIEDLQRRIAELEKALLQSRGLFDALTGSAPVGIYMNDRDGHTIFVNQKCAELVGVRPEEALDFDWIPYLHPDDRDRMVLEWTEAFTAKTPFRSEYRWVHDDGEVVWTLGESVPVRGDDGEVSMFVGTLTDITSRKQAEEEREALREQLSQSQKLESVGRLAGGVAHDYNNMLGVIIGHAELALLEVSPADAIHDDLQEILTAAKRSSDVTRQLLTFARKQIIQPRVCDVNESIDAILSMLRRLIGEDVELTWSPMSGEALVRIDLLQLDQIVMNLCINARDAIDGVGRLAIETSIVTLDESCAAEQDEAVPGPYVRLSISDNGCGMDPDTMRHIFEPFFTTKDKDSGTGLGLSNVHGIVKQHRGSVTVESEVGVGTTFHVHLPLFAGERPGEQASADDAVRMGSGELVLVVEDEGAIMRVAEDFLTRRNFRVLVAATPTEAFALAEQHRAELDLVITDVIMPEVDGPTLAARLRERIPDLKCLFMSGYDANLISREGMIDDGAHFIQKPFRMDDFIAKVHEALKG